MARRSAEVATKEDLAGTVTDGAVNPEYVTVVSPYGIESRVPDTILDNLLDSGYTIKK